MAFTIIKFILQILSLIIFKSFMVYTIIQIIVSIANNYFISYKAEQWYPYIKDKNYLDNASKKMCGIGLNLYFYIKLAVLR